MSNEIGDHSNHEDVELPSMTLSGSFLDTLDFVEETSMSLLVSVGELDETQTKVLVPFVALKVHGSKLSDESPATPILSATLALEDATYLVSDMSQELANALGELVALNEGPVKIEERRLGLVKQYISEAYSAITRCNDAVRKL